ncbi:MAG: alpha/beta hydrolase [Comamonadaceae bacterium]|nr:MAG: alpha/beta hydrolase [Comamonadaceae bacterium]
MTDALAALFPGFESGTVEVEPGVHIAYTTGGNGPPLLLLHGHPQTRAIWHKVAPELARHRTLVIADLRGYGDSTRPTAQADHASYSFRTMAQDQVRLMLALGHAHFDILAHDRGARTAHRLTLDHPARVGRLAVLDIAPTLAMYRQTDEVFARAYWHWFFLIQRAPLPERLIEADPVAYIRDVMGGRSAGLAPFDPRAMAEYERCIALPGAARGICEDYRASAGIDLDHDQADLDAGRKLTQPLLVLWGADGVVQRCTQPLEEWRKVAEHVQGEALPCGHYVPEEAPEALLAKVLPFFVPKPA